MALLYNTPLMKTSLTAIVETKAEVMQPVGTQGELASGGSMTSICDVNVNTETLDAQHCQTRAIFSHRCSLLLGDDNVLNLNLKVFQSIKHNNQAMLIF